jgi:hypothetical protein
MIKNNDYSTIDNPYDSNLLRGVELGFDVGEDTESESLKARAAVRKETELDNLWIDTFIRSKNWSPKKTGFYLNGATGSAEFASLYVGGQLLSPSSFPSVGSVVSGAAGPSFPVGWSVNHAGVGVYDVLHTLGTSGIAPSATISGASPRFLTVSGLTSTQFTVNTFDIAGAPVDADFFFSVGV